MALPASMAPGACSAPDEGLPKGAVQALFLDKNDDLWAATAGGVAKWSDERWLVEPIEKAGGKSFYALLQLNDGSLWAGGEAGLFAKSINAETWQQAGCAGYAGRKARS